ncbi:MAG: response regulator [Lachnospiraceae bacterium]|nr:response regulator [Lachnospiraceae bacterium]
MWIINCILLIIGTVAGVMGISFYFRNKEAIGNFRLYIFLYGICSALWCLSYGIIGITNNLAICDPVRSIGVFAICAFLITEVFLVSEMSGANRVLVKTGKIASVVVSILNFINYARYGMDLFERKDGYTTWTANPEYVINRRLHGIYILIIFILLIYFGITWIRTNRVKRISHFLALVFISNFIMLFFTIPDTFLPGLGFKAIPTSGIGSALCAIVMWYGATQLSSFDIRMGRIKDRVFDFIDVGVIVFDLDRTAALINHYAGRLRAADDNEKLYLQDFFRIDEDMANTMFKESVDDIYGVSLWNKNETNAYSVRLNAVKDNYGEPFCYICAFADVTDEVNAVSKLEVASKAKSRFLAQMSHEIRTPINVVLGMNEMILREAEDENVVDYAQNIDAAGTTLLALINSILDFSKIEDGKMEIIPVKYDTSSLIHDVINTVIQRADMKGLLFEADVDPALPCGLVGDNVRVSQVIINLLSNAVKYTEKGKVVFTIKEEERNADTVRIYISVKDTGIGIKDEEKARLFESFERLDEIRNHSIEGTGLGIPIVTALLEMMGSSLNVESIYGVGSEFSFSIVQKIADDTPIGDYSHRFKEKYKKRKTDSLISAPSAKVLIVDDNEMNLKVAKNLLKLFQIKSDLAYSGKETIEKMRTNSYDIVFLDHMMPEMDGIETLHKLMENHLIPENTTMIALTANAVVGARETYIGAGFDDYLSKPVDVKGLSEKLEKYLPDEAYESIDKTNKTDSAKERSMDSVLEFAPDEDFPEDSSEDNIAVLYDPEKLKAGGIDVNLALTYCANDEAFYYDVLNGFVTGIEEKMSVADSLYKNEDWHDYEIEVHAIKSNAKMIGATASYEMALMLEKAAEQADIEYIRSNHEKFKSNMRKLIDILNSAERGK